MGLNDPSLKYIHASIALKQSLKLKWSALMYSKGGKVFYIVLSTAEIIEELLWSVLKFLWAIQEYNILFEQDWYGSNDRIENFNANRVRQEEYLIDKFDNRDNASFVPCILSYLNCLFLTLKYYKHYPSTYDWNVVDIDLYIDWKKIKIVNSPFHTNNNITR